MPPASYWVGEAMQSTDYQDLDEVPEADAAPAQRVSVMDHKAFVDKYLADLGQEEADFQVCHWPIKSWHALEKRITGPEFE